MGFEGLNQSGFFIPILNCLLKDLLCQVAFTVISKSITPVIERDNIYSSCSGPLHCSKPLATCDLIADLAPSGQISLPGVDPQARYEGTWVGCQGTLVIVQLKGPNLYPPGGQYLLKREIRLGLKPIIDTFLATRLLVPCQSPCHSENVA